MVSAKVNVVRSICPSCTLTRAWSDADMRRKKRATRARGSATVTIKRGLSTCL